MPKAEADVGNKKCQVGRSNQKHDAFLVLVVSDLCLEIRTVNIDQHQGCEANDQFVLHTSISMFT